MAVMACKSQTAQNDQQLLTEGGVEYQTLEELPPYFVEFVSVRSVRDESAEKMDPVLSSEDNPLLSDTSSLLSEVKQDSSGDQYYDSLCSGAHIGGGYILTAAHCIADYFAGCVSREGEFGLHILVKDPNSSQQVKKKLIVFSEVKNVALHQGFFDVIVATSNHTYKTDASMHDIALMRVDPSLQFAGQVSLPTDQQYSPESITSEVWLYGAGIFYAFSKNDRRKYSSARTFFGGTAIIDHAPLVSYQLPSDYNKRLEEELSKTTMSSPDFNRILTALAQMHSVADSANKCIVKSASIPLWYADDAEYYITRQKSKLFENVVRVQAPEIRSSTDVVGVCGGDSGGPVIQYSERDNTPILVGLISRGDSGPNVQNRAQHLVSRFKTSCVSLGSNHGAAKMIFANVFAYNGWISSARTLMEQGGLMPPSVAGRHLGDVPGDNVVESEK